ncbi:MAG: hypothetical protein J6K25_08540 [Thermoguttaceae bacterium]|nr:hypothetical protein [Thermoguttaceae bacterium]
MSNVISSGVKITVDTTDLDVKFLKSVEQLNASLTKSQKALKLVYNEQGLLTNALGQCVEGLSASQIKLGQYVDELGRVRTFQGGFVDGLSKTQLALGFYRDEMGNVRNAADELVDGLSDAAEAVEELTEQLDDAERKSREVEQIFSELPGPLADALDVFEKFDEFADACEKAGLTAAKLGEIFNDKLNRGAYVAGKAVGALANALGRTNVLLAAGATAAFALFKAMQKPAVSEYAEGFQEIERSARAAGKSVESLGDALEIAGGLGGSEISKTLGKIVQIEATGLTQEQNDVVENEIPLLRALGADHINKGAYWLLNQITDADEIEKSEHIAKITEFVAALAESQKSEEERVADQIADLKALLDQTKPEDAATRQTLQKEIERVETEIADAKKLEAQEAAGMVEFAQDRKPAFEATLDNYEATVAAWRKLVDEGNASSEELATAQENLKEKLRDALAKELGVDFDAKPEPTADESFEASKKRLDDALAKGVVSSEQFATAQDQLCDKYADALATRQATDDAEKSVAAKIAEWNAALADGKVAQERCNDAIAELEKAARDQLFAETGVDGEKTLSPLEAYNANVAKWSAALESGTVDQAEFSAAIEKLRDAARAQIAGLETAKTANEEYAETLRKLNEARKAELITEAERARLEAEAAKKRDEARKGELADLGYGARLDRAAALEKSTDDEEKTARERYREELNKYRDALENGRIVQEEFDKAQDALRKIRNAEIKAEEKKAAEDKAKKRDATRSKLGVDALMESLKTPAQKYDETMDDIAAAAKAREITAEERQALEDKAADDYWAALEENNRKFGEATKSLAKAGGGKVELAKSMSSGSEALYLTQVRGITANYQNRIQSTTAEIRDVARESLWQASQTNGYLQTMAEGGGGGARRFVFTGN